MRMAKVRLLYIAGVLLCACDAGLPSDGGPSCSGGVSFVECRRDSRVGSNVECGAQIGFEDDNTKGLSTMMMGDNAFTAMETSSQQAVCGSRALALQATFSAGRGPASGEVTLELPFAVGHGSGVLSVWVYFEGPSTRGLQTFLVVDPIPASSPLILPAQTGIWQRLETRFDRVPAPFDVPARMWLRVFFPNGDWSGVVYLDEISWRAD